jgi:hypothetical protein
VAELTGSVAYERFTIHQIKKIAKTQPEAYPSIFSSTKLIKKDTNKRNEFRWLVLSSLRFLVGIIVQSTLAMDLE